jgi:predicted phosphodiesterase
MKLWALSDLHVGHAKNREAITSLSSRQEDWLILGGDVCESVEDLAWVLDQLSERFAQLLWVPGNHELWVTASDREANRKGVAKYEALVDACQERGVLTPEDPYPQWPGTEAPTVLAPMFLLYDYSFGPDGMNPEQAVAWAVEGGILCADERHLPADPHPSRQAWCASRLDYTERRLDALPPGTRTVLINHWPLRRDLVRLYRIPRFIPWCGTRQTEDWHTRFAADVVVSGHLHMRSTDWRDGVRFEEVSLGYPRHWMQEKGADAYVRQVLPAAEPPPASGHAGPRWHR